MNLLTLAPEYAGTFLLVLARFGGLFIFAPVLSTTILPARAKALIACMLSLSSMPSFSIEVPSMPAFDIVTLAVAVVLEVAIGMTLGILASLPLYAAQLAGHIIDQQIGIGLSASYNPLLDTEGGVVGDLVMYIALAAFIGLDGLDSLYAGVLTTFTQLPPGFARIAESPLVLITSIVSTGYELAIRVAAPVLCMILVELICSFFITKTMPQINIMSIGFPIKVILGLAAMILGIRAIGTALSDAVLYTSDSMLGWAASL